jgi:polar amino acid transport system permease protein
MDWSVLWGFRGALAQGASTTIEITVLAIIGSTCLGLIVSSAELLPSYLSRRLARTYIEAVRNVPGIVKVFVLYYVVGLDAFEAGVIGLSIHQSAYIADVISSGLRAIPQEQTDAGRVLGCSYSQTYFFILIPQLLKATAPPLTSQYIEVLKNSSIVMILGLPELTYYTQEIEFQTGKGFLAAGVVTILYLLLALGISGLMKVAELAFRRMA